VKRVLDLRADAGLELLEPLSDAPLRVVRQLAWAHRNVPPGTDGFLRLALLDAPIPGVTEGDLLVSVQQPARLYSDS